MTRTTPLRSGKTRNRKSETGKRIALIQLLMRKLRYIKRIPNDTQQILDEMLRNIQHSIRLDWEKENPAYTELITEKNDGKMQGISSVHVQRISSLQQRKLQETTEEKLCAQSIQLLGQKILLDQKERNTGPKQIISRYVKSIWKIATGTDLRIWISSLMLSPKNSRYSAVFT